MKDACEGVARAGIDGLRPCGRLSRITRYSTPRPTQPIDLWLDANEAASPEEAFLRDVAARSVREVNRYPSMSELEAAIGEQWSVGGERVVVTNGADEALERACQAMVEPGDRVTLTRPTFSMLARYVIMSAGEVEEVPWWDGAFPTEAFIQRARETVSPVVFIVSPNNPTGCVAAWADVERISAELPGTLVVLDQAYGEFADEDLTARALGLPNVVVTRTMSKAWGLAGLRVGYALGPARVIEWLRTAGQPYPVASVAARMALACLKEAGTESAARIERVKREREELSRVIRGLGGKTTRSQANFVFATLRDAGLVRDVLAGLGISVRAFGGELAGTLRITCPGDAAAFERLVDAVRAALAPVSVGLSGAGRCERGSWVVTSDVAEVRRLRERGVVPIGLVSSETDAGMMLAAGVAFTVRDVAEAQRRAEVSQ